MPSLSIGRQVAALGVLALAAFAGLGLWSGVHPVLVGVVLAVGIVAYGFGSVWGLGAVVLILGGTLAAEAEALVVFAAAGVAAFVSLWCLDVSRDLRSNALLDERARWHMLSAVGLTVVGTAAFALVLASARWVSRGAGIYLPIGLLLTGVAAFVVAAKFNRSITQTGESNEDVFRPGRRF